MTIYGPVISTFRPNCLAYCMSKGYVFEPTSIPNAAVHYFVDCENGDGPFRQVAGIHRRPDGTFVARMLHGSTTRDLVFAAETICKAESNPQWLQKCTCGICKGGFGYVMVCHEAGLEDGGMSLEAFERVTHYTKAPVEITSTTEVAR